MDFAELAAGEAADVGVPPAHHPSSYKARQDGAGAAANPASVSAPVGAATLPSLLGGYVAANTRPIRIVVMWLSVARYRRASAGKAADLCRRWQVRYSHAGRERVCRSADIR